MHRKLFLLIKNKKVKLILMESLPEWAPGEELLNSLTHGMMIPVVIYLTSKLIKQQMMAKDKVAVFGVAVYGVTIFAMFFNSTIYHGATYQPLKRILRYLDHCTIFIHIAGSYTPFILYALRDKGGIALLVFVWAAAVVGIISKIFFFDLIEGTYIYLAMGWSIVFRLRELIKAIEKEHFLWILAGGIAYSAGCIFFELDYRYDFVHCVFHLFINVANLCHFKAIYMLGEKSSISQFLVQ